MQYRIHLRSILAIFFLCVFPSLASGILPAPAFTFTPSADADASYLLQVGGDLCLYKKAPAGISYDQIARIEPRSGAAVIKAVVSGSRKWVIAFESFYENDAAVPRDEICIYDFSGNVVEKWDVQKILRGDDFKRLLKDGITSIWLLADVAAYDFADRVAFLVPLSPQGVAARRYDLIMADMKWISYNEERYWPEPNINRKGPGS